MQSKNEKIQVFKYLLIAFGISLLVGILLYVMDLYRLEAQDPRATLYALILGALMFAPSFSVLVLHKFNFKEVASNYQIGFKNIRWVPLLIYTMGFIILFSALILILTYVLGDVLEISGVGHLVTESEKFKEILVEMSGDKKINELDFPGINPVMLLLPLGVVSSIIAGFTINGFFALGEELGWRGFLINKLQYLGGHKMNLAIGVVWGLWHAPIIYLGHNYPNYPIIGIFMMIPFCISLSYALSYLRKITNTTLSAAILHGMINAMAGTLMLLVSDNHELIGGPVGVISISSILLTHMILRSAMHFFTFKK